MMTRPATRTDPAAPARWPQAVALGCAVAASLFALFGPLYRVTSTRPGGPAEQSTLSGWAVGGPAMLPAVLLPILLAGLPLIVRGRHARLVGIVCVGLQGLGAAAASSSIGLLYLPATLAAALALVAGRSARRRGAAPAR